MNPVGLPKVMKTDKEEFNYAAAVEELESIAAKIEDPGTAIADIEKYIERSVELVALCRAYLRSARERLADMDDGR